MQRTPPKTIIPVTLYHRHKKLLLGFAVAVVVIVALLVFGNKAFAPDGANTSPVNPAAEDTQQPVQFDKTKYSTDDPASIWVIVNKQRPLNPLTYAPDDLVTVSDERMRSDAANALEQMFTAASAAGHQLDGLSGYRSYSRQQTVYGREVNTYGQAVADTQSAKPGYSEHQSGLSIDIGGGGCGIEDCFGDTPEGKWVAANAYKYGFIIRYPDGKEPVTGYRYEPWHVRYVGIELATEMHAQNILTLEEFFGL